MALSTLHHSGKQSCAFLFNYTPVIKSGGTDNERNRENISKITRLKTGRNDIGYTHRLSHRKQVYVDPDDAEKIPQAAQLIHEDIAYWIYFFCDKLSCFLCKDIQPNTAKM